MASVPMHAQMLIDGEWVDTSEKIEVRNPANPEELVGTIPCGSSENAVEAIAAAKAAQPGWAALSFVERAKMLAVALDAFSQGIEKRARLYSRENGRVLSGVTTTELHNVPASTSDCLCGSRPDLDSGRKCSGDER